MQDWIRQVLRERREQAGITLAQVEYATSRDRGNLSKFERGVSRELRDLDGVVAGYADLLGVEPIDLWQEALDRWKATLPRTQRRRRVRQRRSS